jgi:hypothetical protein
MLLQLRKIFSYLWLLAVSYWLKNKVQKYNFFHGTAAIIFTMTLFDVEFFCRYFSFAQ